MAKTYRAQIIWDFEVDDDGYTENEREFMEWDLEEDETPEPRSEEQIINYVRSELVEALYNSIKYNDLYQMVDVVVVNE
jgi:hypothetical protein